MIALSVATFLAAMGAADVSEAAPAFEDILKIDVHSHVFDDVPELVEMMDRVNLRIVNICLYGNRPEALIPMEQQAEYIHGKYPKRFYVCSTFDLTHRAEPDYAAQVNAWLDKTFEGGAVMTKLWKEVGMAIQEPSGAYLMPDAPVFDPIYAHLAAVRKPLMAHLADPIDAWRPLDQSSMHFGYYSKNPEWYVYGREGVPAHEQIIAARDRILEKHPDLIMIAAHLGSLEHDLDGLAERLDKYPNLYIDTSARKPDLARHPVEKVHDFFVRYQDRIMYGVDLDPCHFPEPGPIPDEKRKTYTANLEKAYRSDYLFFSHVGKTKFGENEVECLGLPRSVLEKFYHGNAQRLMPGLAN
jgi:predicted TIM-barrel fold metal-dependent hydrolase